MKLYVDDLGLHLCPLFLSHRYEMGVAPGVRTCRTYIVSLALLAYTSFVSVVSVTMVLSVCQ